MRSRVFYSQAWLGEWPTQTTMDCILGLGATRPGPESKAETEAGQSVSRRGHAQGGSHRDEPLSAGLICTGPGAESAFGSAYQPGCGGTEHETFNMSTSTGPKPTSPWLQAIYENVAALPFQADSAEVATRLTEHDYREAAQDRRDHD